MLDVRIPEGGTPQGFEGVSGEKGIDQVWPTLSFEHYRSLCDRETECFRRVGVQEEDAYEQAIEDPRTVFCVFEGQRVPALVPLEYEARHDAARTEALSGRANAMLLSIPLTKVRQGALSAAENLTGGELFPDDFVILIEEPADAVEGDRSSDHASIAQMLGGFGPMQPGEFIDERIDEQRFPENRTAWMGIYSFSMESTRDVSPELAAMDPEDALAQAWEEYREEKGFPAMPDEHSNGTFLFTAEQLKEHPEIIDGLWQVSKEGFGKVLGEYHPVAMEVTKSFFDEHITSDTILTVVRYKDGEAACFGFLAPNMEQNDWLDLNSTTLKNDLEEAANRGEQVAHFFELISKGEKGAHLSPSVLGLYAKLLGRSREKWHVIFESTNLSDTYIPAIAESIVDRAPDVELTDRPTRLSKLHYWSLVPATEATEPE